MADRRSTFDRHLELVTLDGPGSEHMFSGGATPVALSTGRASRQERWLEGARRADTRSTPNQPPKKSLTQLDFGALLGEQWVAKTRVAPKRLKPDGAAK